MPRTFRERMRGERGFALVELLATILILGILAAIVLTQYIGHKDRSEDAEAKSYARNLVTQVESCFVANEDYNDCNTLAELETSGGVPYGTAPGQASVTDATKMSYEIEGVSHSQLGGSRHVFTISKDVGTGVITKTCTPVGKGGCPDSGNW
jgi:type IV pilus assembly protein PilA